MTSMAVSCDVTDRTVSDDTPSQLQSSLGVRPVDNDVTQTSNSNDDCSSAKCVRRPSKHLVNGCPPCAAAEVEVSVFTDVHVSTEYIPVVAAASTTSRQQET